MCQETVDHDALYVKQFIVYQIPCYVFILAALYSKCIAKPKLNKLNSSRSEPLINNQSQNSKGLITSINYYIFYKSSMAIALIYIGLIIHSLVFSDESWFLCGHLSLSFMYLFPSFAWFLSANMVDILFAFQFEIISWEVRGFWIVSFLFDSIELLTKPEVMIVRLLDILRMLLMFILFAYALARPWTKLLKNNEQNSNQMIKTLNVWLERFEKNFYVRAIFLGDILEKQITQVSVGKKKRTNSAFSGGDLELPDLSSNDRLRDLNSKLEGSKAALTDEEEDEFLSNLPNIRILIWTEMPTLGTNPSQGDPRIYFTIYTYVTYDIQNRKEVKVEKKYSEILELEREAKALFQMNPFFRKVPEFRKLHISEFENNEEALRRERIKTIESYFNNDLLKEPDSICPVVLFFLGLSKEDCEPFELFWSYRLRTKKMKVQKKNPYSKQLSKNSNNNNIPDIDAASIEEVFEEEDEDDEFSKNKFYTKDKRITNSAPRTFESKQGTFDNSFLPNFEIRVENAAMENDQLFFNINVKEKSSEGEWLIQKTFSDITELNKNLELILKKEINLLKFSNSKSIGSDDEASKRKKKNDVENFLRGILINPNCMGDVIYDFLQFDNTAFKRRLARNFSDILGRDDEEIVRKVSCLEKHENPVPLVRDKNAFSRTNSLQKNAKIHKSFTSYFRGLSKISIPFYEIKDNSNEPLFTIYYDEYYSESSDKIRRRIIIAKVLSELEQLHFDLVKFYQPFEKRMPILNAEIKKKDKIFEFLKRTEEYFNEVLRLPNLENCEDFIKFFNLKNVSEKSKSSQGGMLVYNFTNL